MASENAVRPSTHSGFPALRCRRDLCDCYACRRERQKRRDREARREFLYWVGGKALFLVIVLTLWWLGVIH